ncbi:hypothetical protein IAQ61_009293 [Plenodomus lingam]|uniref:Uncharacterized protein n=1 Tax=Leptosphaeria maculans (strain JN3 / isolate v23.1.3 / race Av1-4-5-6-7-8) TaxID=985895 RepID=E4ZTP4_LEPMJ|nr:hypothetical protein LEMA_P116070.1 [Plenodomus lingam JN3]KAH9863018.1 hypothetical protein IAQ61_009293 [Plenodomus lingam]CBX94604.1 hypothetical protein LEMA_P116070.1 [Plenodomus lingam JN3]
MRFTSEMLVALAAVATAGVMAAPPPSFKGQYKVEVIISPGRVDIGDLNWQHEIRDFIYAAKDNQIGIKHNPIEPLLSFTNQCTNHADTNGHLKVHIHMDGSWGTLPGIGPNDAREHLIEAVMQTLHADSDYTGYNVFTNCWGTSWQEGVPIWKGPHACGGTNPTVRPQCMCTVANAQCEKHSWGHTVPSAISARIYDVNSNQKQPQKQPEVHYLNIEFSSDKIEPSKDCGPIGTIISRVTGFLPGPGSLFSSTIDIFCD